MKRLVLFLTLLALSAAGFAQTVDLRVTQVAQVGDVVDIRNAGDGSQRLFLVDKEGQILILSSAGDLLATPFLDLTDRVLSRGNEQGLLSMAFAPDYASSGVFYVYYTEEGRASVLSRFRVSGNANVADLSSEERVLVIPQPGSNHNGGRLVFGPDGLLYWSLGDGGGSNDQFNQGQDRSSLLAGILRLDVSTAPGYRVPSDNPFVNDPDGADELWSYGLRNPWRISFDAMTGDLYIADVGQESTEEINVQPASSQGGENYGWPLFEGGSGGDPALTFPVHTYEHEDRSCSVTGGEVYRGPDYPNLLGKYIYGDFCSRKIWALSQQSGQWTNELLIDTGVLGNIQTFGQDERGNIYVSATEGGQATQIYLLSDGPPVTNGTGSGIAIDGSLSGTYIVNGLNDQGFFVTVGNNASGSFLFVAWFTFDENGAPRWLVGVSGFEPGATSVELVMEEVSGLPFLDFSDNTAGRTTFGSMNFSAISCGRFNADYDFGAQGNGTLELEQLTNIQGRDC